ncbi:MAG: hypothetical protein IJZ85_10985 [Lachnospiraceae bacterium]|nr:hypothetical protein [Lachnospiraceae bacterium]
MKIIIKTKDKVEYENIQEITRQVVKEELQKFNTDQSTPLTKEDIQDAVCKGIALATKNADDTNEEGKKVGFWKSVWSILRGKGSDNSSFATALLVGVLSVGFEVLFWIGMLAFVGAIFAICQVVSRMTWACGYFIDDVIKIMLSIAICILLFLISIMFRGAANDMQREKDRNYIVALFSGVVSFVALIVSLVALVKG